jgi:3',5'-cyclic AMP phosphodiesterase CpdA
MRIAHLSDLHVFASVKETRLVRDDVVDRVRRLVGDVQAFRPGFDAVLITGDVADGGSAEDYALVRRLLAPLAVPILVVPGNHDRRETMREAFADLVPFEEGPHLQFCTSLGALRIVGLDSQVPGKVEGRLCPERLAWLGRVLARPHDGWTILMLHHPPFPTGMGVIDEHILIEGAAGLGAILAAQPRPVSLLCGHVHRPIQTLWNGAFAATAGSPAFQFELVFGLPEDPPTSDEAFAYHVHAIDPPGRMAVHPRLVDLQG